MNLFVSNRFLQILNKSERINKLGKNKKKKVINRIMVDMNKIGLFDISQEDTDTQFDEIELEVDKFFGDKNYLKVNDRIKRKQIELGLCDKNDNNKEDNNKSYGRTPLHEAISLRDIESIKKYLEQGKYLKEKDHNGNTAYAMAFYEKYNEAIKLFKELRSIL